uniref:Peptidase S1 domain-containing protein n=1 Tax=Panagrolaimus sp. ES5 TaxID=591445 RepID=A0AC34GDH8_9BILA
MAKPENPFNISDYGIVNDFYFHEGWHWQSFQHDIAIIEFPVGTKLGEPIKLAKNYEEGLNDVGINVGYGDTDPSPNDAEHPVICAGNSTHRSDHGDSGGPLFFDTSDGKRYQIGITHDGALKNGSADETHAETTAFIRVSAYCDWIEEKTKGEAKCEEIKKSTESNVPAPTDAPDVSSATNNLNDTTKIAPIKELPEAQHDNNGSTSKNIFAILSTLFF